MLTLVEAVSGYEDITACTGETLPVERSVLVDGVLGQNGLDAFGAAGSKELDLAVPAKGLVLMHDRSHLRETCLAAGAVEALVMVRLSFVLQPLIYNLLLTHDASRDASSGLPPVALTTANFSILEDKLLTGEWESAFYALEAVPVPPVPFVQHTSISSAYYPFTGRAGGQTSDNALATESLPVLSVKGFVFERSGAEETLKARLVPIFSFSLEFLLPNRDWLFASLTGVGFVVVVAFDAANGVVICLDEFLSSKLGIAVPAAEVLLVPTEV